MRKPPPRQATHEATSNTHVTQPPAPPGTCTKPHTRGATAGLALPEHGPHPHLPRCPWPEARRRPKATGQAGAAPRSRQCPRCAWTMPRGRRRCCARTVRARPSSATAASAPPRAAGAASARRAAGESLAPLSPAAAWPSSTDTSRRARGTSTAMPCRSRGHRRDRSRGGGVERVGAEGQALPGVPCLVHQAGSCSTHTHHSLASRHSPSRAPLGRPHRPVTEGPTREGREASACPRALSQRGRA
jgi:hypothetical protein